MIALHLKRRPDRLLGRNILGRLQAAFSHRTPVRFESDTSSRWWLALGPTHARPRSSPCVGPIFAPRNAADPERPRVGQEATDTPRIPNHNSDRALIGRAVRVRVLLFVKRRTTPR